MLALRIAQGTEPVAAMVDVGVYDQITAITNQADIEEPA
ncbi:hypothetical protein FHX47_000091 [Garicola koreensis]|uniref:Uncharacterized protein n=1 Tax=Garicola koreensis TaxID=1262554 RepID=A0A7W5TRQ3_9MICC|nr:hypothetical protein [Garicola koreensis]